MSESALMVLARDQWGTFTRKQALRFVGPGIIRSRLSSGLWVRLQPGVYAPAGMPGMWEQRLFAALSRPTTRACASHLTAAALWDWVQQPASIDITVWFDGHHPTGRGLVVHRSRHLPRRDVVLRHGFRTTSAPRTIIDIAGVVRRDALAAVLDTALRTRSVSLASLHRHIELRRQWTRPGARRLRSLLVDREGGVPESELERRFIRVVRRARLAEPKRQVHIGRRRVDFAYPERRLAIELDGVTFHGSPAAIASDRQRQNDLILRGWAILRFGWDDVTKHPDHVVRSIELALSR